tara:strand:- start:104 stop:568 length:465 start_codon:yes stop_codon:yes gene_type:complete
MSHSSKNWQVIYRHQGSLAGCFVWAPDEAQAEKKFKARKEFEYDPEFDRDEDEGNIRSIYEYVMPQPNPSRSKMDELEAFVKFPQFYPFLKKYDSGDEKALAKQIPLTADNIAIIDGIAKVMPIIRRYRGPRVRGGYMRECHKQDAERVSIYAR